MAKTTQDETAVARRADDPIPVVAQPAELSVDDVCRQVEKIQDAMRRAMQRDVHYGVIPGTQKPSLLQPGAEKLCVLFRLAPDYEVRCERDPSAERPWTKTDRSGRVYKQGLCKGFIRYTVICRLVHGPSRMPIAAGTGTANNWEPKFVSRDPYEVEETVLQFARKRALVNAVRTGMAASDIFTQDVEDAPPEALNDDAAHLSEESDNPAAAVSGRTSPPIPPGVTEPPCVGFPDVPPPVCPKCGGAMWDNRARRAQAEREIEAGTRTKSAPPAWTCKDRECGGKYWPLDWREKPQERPANPAARKSYPKSAGSSDDAPPPGIPISDDAPATDDQIKEARALYRRIDVDEDAFSEWLAELHPGAEKPQDLTVGEMKKLLARMARER